MKPFGYILFGAFPWISFTASADSLTEIAAFAEKICDQSLSGGETSTTIKANLNGDLNGLAKALGISVGAGRLPTKEGSHSSGAAWRSAADERPGQTKNTEFQGQEAPAVIYSMTTSTHADAPRGMGFLYSLNRLNVATSRANALAILVTGPP